MTVYVPGTEETDLKKINMSLQQLGSGRSNAHGTVTLTVSVATTVVTVTQTGLITPSSTVLLEPMSAAAAAERASGNLYISSVGADTFTITHTNSATAGRTFRWAVHG
jgi:hypothetical protein